MICPVYGSPLLFAGAMCDTVSISSVAYCSYCDAIITISIVILLYIIPQIVLIAITITIITISIVVIIIDIAVIIVNGIDSH